MGQKYQREIEEILSQADVGTGRPRSNKPGFFRQVWTYLKHSLGGRAFSITPGRIMVTGICLLLSALVVNAFTRGIVGPIAWAGLVLFIIGYAMFFIKPRKTDKRWRGQPIEDHDDKSFGRKK